MAPMPMSKSAKSIPVSSRVHRFSYAIRNIVAEAQAVEARGLRVRYLNIGDPVAFGFQPPPHLIEAAQKAMRDGHNGYLPSPGIPAAREAVANDYTNRGVPTTPDRVLITTGTSEGIDLAMNALVDEGDEVLVPLPTYPMYTAIIAKIGAQARYYRTDPNNGWQPDIDHLRSLITPRTRVLVMIDPNNPTGAVYSTTTRRALIDVAEEHGLIDDLTRTVFREAVRQSNAWREAGMNLRVAVNLSMDNLAHVDSADFIISEVAAMGAQSSNLRSEEHTSELQSH